MELESISLSANRINISDIVCNIGRSVKFAVWLNAEISVNPDYFEDGIISDVCEADFVKAINMLISIQDKVVLPALIDMVSDRSITMVVFDLLLSYPFQQARELIYTSLSHKMLSVEQLEVLCNIGNCFECFFSLAIALYCSSEYTADQFENSVIRFQNSKYAEMHAEFLEELLDNKASEPLKRTIAQKYLKDRLTIKSQDQN